MAKIGDKEAQRRALREAQAKVVVGEAEKAAAGPDTPPVPKAGRAKFDRVAYQRQYMRRWRAGEVGKGQG